MPEFEKDMTIGAMHIATILSDDKHCADTAG